MRSVAYPEFDHHLGASPAFASLPSDVQGAIRAEARELFLAGLPAITEDTMPGERANIMAGRVAALFNLRGPNFTTDAACASALAGMSAAIGGLHAHHYDAVVTGGVAVGAKETAPDEVRGTVIEGGETRRIVKGDVITVPAGTPHWFKEVKGPIAYYTVKVR